MQIRPQLIALINISWNHARRNWEGLLGRKAAFMHHIEKACLVRRKIPGLALPGGKNQAAAAGLLKCPQVIWKSVHMVPA